MGLIENFWSRFPPAYWEQRPLGIPQGFSPPLVSEAVVFRAALEASEQFRAERDVALAFYIEHARQVASVGDYLPVAADGCLARYEERISRQVRGPFALIIEDIQAYAPELWWSFREFLRGLEKLVPAAAGMTRKATAFIGNYPMTPSGLHVGTSSNFKFIVSGRKRMRLWPDEFLRDRRGLNHTTHIENLLPEATTLEGSVGDVIYWPSDQWHVGEALDGLAVSLSLAVFVKSTTRRPAEADERALARWLNQKTGAGFGHVPTHRECPPLPASALVRLDPRFPILWQASCNGAMICSANGHAFALPTSARTVALLELLNTGQALEVGSLMASYGRIGQLLEKLHQLRAISAVPGEAAIPVAHSTACEDRARPRANPQNRT